MEISVLKAELEKLHPASLGWALSCCRRDTTEAEEVLQTVYLKILQGKAVYRGESKLQTWLFAVIRKTAISERRKQWLRTLIPLSGSTSNDNRKLESEFERSEMHERFQQALAQLPVRQRETLHLVFNQDLSLSEAAEVMNISVGSARRHYERGKQRLRAVTAAVVVLAAVSSFALWSKYNSIQNVLNITPLEIPAPAKPQLSQFAAVVESPRAPRQHQKRTMRPRETENTYLREAALLSHWQSPTQNFMQSPGGVSFSSLPQLDQSAKDLESFLPKKESNR
jgi:RNA polymerase sigma-70 factor (ECF subfamily)